MRELNKFLNILRKYRLTLIIVPIMTVIITFFLVRNLPNVYQSQAQMATGIVGETQQASILVQAVQADQVGQKFSNLIESMRMKKVLDQVSYQLMIHDLTSPKPFKPESKLVSNLNPQARAHAIDVYRDKYDKVQELTLSNPDQNGLFQVLKSMKYDAESIRDKLLIYRQNESDYLVIQFESENPDLSALVVNLVSSEFIKNYTTALKASQEKGNNFLRGLLQEKSDTLATRMTKLRNYKVKNRVLNLTEQSKQLYTLIMEYDTRKQQAIERTSSYAGALNEIDRKFNPKERSYVESTLSKVNQSIASTKDQLSSLYSLYIENDLDEKYKRSYDSLRTVLTEQINKASDQYIVNPLNTKQELITQKLNLEIQMDLARYSINSLENKLNALNSQFDKLVPREADVQSLEMNVDIASKEYLETLNRYNQSNLQSGFIPKLAVIQDGVPGLAQPSKKMLLVILSGIISFVVCVIVLFIIFFLDNSVVDPVDLANQTDLPVLGSVASLVVPSVDLNSLWHQESTVPRLMAFKNELRSLRYEIENDLKGKVLIFTSMGVSEGKTLLALSLAFAWKMTGKRVLVIDGNFSNSEITRSSANKVYLEDFFKGTAQLPYSATGGVIEILSNKGGDTSLLELASHEQIKTRLEWAKGTYDLILIETAALDGMNQSKEWMLFGDSIVGVFEAGKNITDEKKDYVSYLKETNLFLGWIFNKADTKAS